MYIYKLNIGFIEKKKPKIEDHRLFVCGGCKKTVAYNPSKK